MIGFHYSKYIDILFALYMNTKRKEIACLSFCYKKRLFVRAIEKQGLPVEE